MPAAAEQNFSILFHDEYVARYKIDLIKFSQRHKTLSKAYSLVNHSEPQNLSYESTLLHGKRYAITANASEQVYYGALKDNKPNGFGVICDALSDQYCYIGNFEKGFFEGYGITFNNTTVDIGEIDAAVERGYLLASDHDKAGFYIAHCASYEGEWTKGKRSGKGNEFKITGRMNDLALDGFWAGVFYPMIYSGEFSNDEYDGNSKFYAYGCMLYQGESKGEEPEGKGIAYYINGQVQYDGQWKKGRYHGTGTLYAENGDVIYQGKWNNGDYAS